MAFSEVNVRNTGPLNSPFDWSEASGSKVSLDAAGLVALADLSTITRRTVLSGNGTWLDMFVICPGLHRQQSAPELNQGEYPAVAALTTGYVFRVENPATVVYLQKMSKTGHLTTFDVSRLDNHSKFWPSVISSLFAFRNSNWLSTLAYFLAAAISIAALTILCLANDKWGVGVMSILMFSRLLNTIVIRRRCQIDWKGKKEPGVQGDLLVLSSQDRWIRLQGSVDDLKMVTSGEWLREQSFMESSITAIATVLVYLNAALASNVSDAGRILLLIVLVCSVGLLAIANECTDKLFMHGCMIEVKGRKAYGRRLDLVDELLSEQGPTHNDWAKRVGMAGLGMTIPEDKTSPSSKTRIAATM